MQLEEFAGPGITSKTQTEARCASVEQHSQQLEAQNAELASELADLRSQYNSMRAELDQRLAASKQQWTSEKEALLHKHAEQVRKLKEAAREQVMSQCVVSIMGSCTHNWFKHRQLWYCKVQACLLCAKCSSLHTIDAMLSHHAYAWQQSLLWGSPGK